MLDVKSPSSTSLAVTPSNISNLSLTLITASSVFIVGFTLLVDNLGFTIIPWSDVFPFPLSLTCISNLLTLGVDQTIGANDNSSISFKVIADGKTLETTKVLKYNDNMVEISVPVKGVTSNLS